MNQKKVCFSSGLVLGITIILISQCSLAIALMSQSLSIINNKFTDDHEENFFFSNHHVPSMLEQKKNCDIETSQSYKTRFLPITIYGNNDLRGLRGKLHGVTGGKGTAEDPYVISGWEIPGRWLWAQLTVYWGISIGNVDKHVVIKNNYIHDWWFDLGAGFFFSGIKVYNCHNITIDNNLITGIWGSGIAASSSSVIQFNNISGNRVGIVTTGYDMICNNTVCYNYDDGIACNEADAYVAYNCVFSNGEDGIYSKGYDSSLITYNMVYENARDGIGIGVPGIGDVPRSIIAHNQIFSNKGFGISCWDPMKTVISNNSIYSNKRDGIYCSGSNPTIIDNTISSNNGDYGIQILGDDGVPPSTISHNTITSHRTGIQCAFSNWIITYNIISGNSNKGIDVGDSQPQIHYNNFANNSCAIFNFGYMGRRTNATENWWGASDGPSGEGTGSGDPISAWVDYNPWLTEPNPNAGPR